MAVSKQGRYWQDEIPRGEHGKMVYNGSMGVARASGFFYTVGSRAGDTVFEK